MPAVGRARVHRRFRARRVGRPRGGAILLNDKKPLTHEHMDAVGRRYTVKGGKIHYVDLPKDRRIVSEHNRTSKSPRWRGDRPDSRL